MSPSSETRPSETRPAETHPAKSPGSMSPYRIGGAVVAIAAAAALLWVAIASFASDGVVSPSATVRAEPAAGQRAADAAPDARGVLRQRTGLQRWRAGRETSAPSAVGEPSLRFERGDRLENGRALVESWRADPPEAAALAKRGFVEGSSSLPYAEAATFEQPEGRDWRQAHNGPIRYGGGWLIFGMILALALFLFFRGRIRLNEGYSGERIERFNAIERANHWMTATSFILMALTGLALLYGKPALLPLIGHDAMGALGAWSAWLHMALAAPFALGVAMMVALWVVGNLPDRYDWPWLKRFGGFLDDQGEGPPAARFNAGQKIVFWGVVLGGLALLVSGLAMMFPFFWLGYDGMQWAQSAHAAIALAMVVLILGHIYIGSVGMEDAFSAMWSGMVDRNWLKEHHRAWYEQIKGRRRAAAGASEDGAASTAQSGGRT